MKPSQSLYIDVRGVRYHCRVWEPVAGASDGQRTDGQGKAPTLFMLHGWMDVSASFQFLVDALSDQWRVVAPDWRGFGETAWNIGTSYWFPDYLADLESLLNYFQPQGQVNLLGHSMGGNIASLYAGIRPTRVARLINVEGFGMRATVPAAAPERYARWLDALGQPRQLRGYVSFEQLAERLQQQNPRLNAERALFLARHWGVMYPSAASVNDKPVASDRVRLRADPHHKLINPLLYQLEEAKACWQRVSAPVLWVTGSDTGTLAQLGIDVKEHRQRRLQFSRLQSIEIADSGHMVHHDQPEALAQVIEKFL
jgi:pimeloyl-ACP methyl ester carboxylesterase